MASFSQMQSQFQSQMQSQGLALPLEHLVGPSGPRVSTKESYVDPSGNDFETSDSDRCGLYIEANPAHLVTLGRVYKGSTIVGVEEVKDPDAPVPVPTDEVSLVGQTIHTFLAWPTHLDATVFGVFNLDFPLYRKHKDLSEIAHGGQCLSISVLQLWIFMQVSNSDIYGFLEPQSIQRSWQSYIKSWIQSSKRDVYLGAYLNGPYNYLKGIINRQKGSTECGYYVMHWMSTIILGSFRNNWEAYFNNPRPLELERLKAL
ncbi:hypothetical protein GmHk_20G057075 [Glycine max]|nr:hypothetical protein GmHk_20G057075 [Glycine max]